MKKTKDSVSDCIALLEKLIRKTQQSLKAAPDGFLKIDHVKNGTYYGIRSEDERRIFQYTTDMKTVRLLAQKHYDQKALRLLEKKLNAANKIAAALNDHFTADMDEPAADRFSLPFPYEAFDELYDSLSPDRQALIIPVVPTTAQYVEEWLSRPYEGKEFRIGDNSAFYTKKKERVRSKSELLIANALYDADIPYKYECPLYLGSRTLYPDFTILQVRTRREIYFEHCGMMDDPDYLNQFLWKIDFYRDHEIRVGENLILTMESADRPLDSRTIDRIIEQQS